MMKLKAVAVVFLSIAMGFPAASQAMAAEKLVITLKVTNEGLVSSKIPMHDKKMTVPKGSRVRLVFDHADTNRNTHQFSLVSSRTEITASPITPDGAKSASIEFTAGERGEAFYRLSCDLPCIAMEALSDYIITVGPSTL